VTADVGVCDTLVYVELLIENAMLRGDSLVDVQRQLEIAWLEFAFVQEEESL
jgi:hypothetical protein